MNVKVKNCIFFFKKAEVTAYLQVVCTCYSEQSTILSWPTMIKNRKVKGRLNCVAPAKMNLWDTSSYSEMVFF